MRSSRLFRRIAAGLCAAAMLCGGMAAAAAAPALPAAPAAAETTNASPSDAELKAALSKFTVTYDEETGGWDLSSPQEQASMEKKSCGLYPYMFVQDDGIAFNMILTYAGSKKLDIKTVNVTADDNMYTFTCDEEYGGGYDQDLGCWFDLELFQLSDDEISWLSEWLNAKSVTAVFVGRNGTTQSYALTKENRTAIQEMVTAYNLMLSSTVEQCKPIFASLTKQETKKQEQELIISGKTDFDYFYTYKDTLNYKCFSLTKNGKRFYASVREDLYDYYKNAFKNRSLTLKGTYQFTAGDGSPVVKVSTLVEGTKETYLSNYLWALNKGSSKNPNFKAYADLKGDGLILSAAKDGQSITIDSNPWGASKGSQAYQLSNDLALLYIKELNSEFGLPDWLYTEMVSTRAVDGRQKEVFDYVTVTWSYHPDSGINILYRKNN